MVCVCTKSVPFNKLTETTTPSQTLSITTIYIAFVNTQRERSKKPGKSAQVSKRENLMGNLSLPGDRDTQIFLVSSILCRR